MIVLEWGKSDDTTCVKEQSPWGMRADISSVSWVQRKIIFAGFNAKLEKNYISKLTNGNNSLHEPSNVKVVKVINIAATKNIIVKCTMFTFCNIHTHTLRLLLMGKFTARLFAFHQIDANVHIHLMTDFSEQLNMYCLASSDWKR